jgi:hypothetical protein
LYEYNPKVLELDSLFISIDVLNYHLNNHKKVNLKRKELNKFFLYDQWQTDCMLSFICSIWSLSLIYMYTNMRSDNKTILVDWVIYYLIDSVYIYMLIMAMNRKIIVNALWSSLCMSGFFFSLRKKRNLNSYYRCSFLLFQLILYSIIIPTVYERTYKTFRNSRSHNWLSRTIVVFPLVFKLNTFSLFFYSRQCTSFRRLL